MQGIPKEFKKRVLISSEELEALTGWDSRKQYDLRKQYKDIPHLKIGRNIHYKVPGIFNWITKHEKQSKEPGKNSHNELLLLKRVCSSLKTRKRVNKSKKSKSPRLKANKLKALYEINKIKRTLRRL